MKQLRQSKFKKGTTEYENISSPNGEVKAFRVNSVSGNLEYTTDYTNFSEVGGGQEVLTGATDPTTATVGEVGQFYLNKTTNKLFQCQSAGGGSYTWGVPSNLVTTDTAQTITGAKTFDNQVTFTNSGAAGTNNLSIKNDNGYNAKIKMGSTENMRLMTGGTYFGATAGVVTDNSFDLGASGAKWKDLYLAGNITDGTNSVSVANITPKSMVADAFSTSATYAVGDVVIYGNTLYRCTTPVTTAGDWDSTKWTATTLEELIPTNAVTLGTETQTFEGNKYLNIPSSKRVRFGYANNANTYTEIQTYFGWGSNMYSGIVNCHAQNGDATIYGQKYIKQVIGGGSKILEIPNKAGTLALTSDIPTALTNQEIDDIMDAILV